MSLHYLNTASKTVAADLLSRCCGATAWVEGMVNNRPFSSPDHLLEQANAVWWSLSPKDWLEAFDHHPKIGDVENLRQKFAKTAVFSAAEQASMNDANEQVIQALAKGNSDYEDKFGHIFIVCATGKSAAEMLDSLNERLPNQPENELRIAAGEQAKITHIRLNQHLEETKHMGISTHVLDTAKGQPAQGIDVTLARHENGAWVQIGMGTTDDDGRIGDLLVDGLTTGMYRIVFATGTYFIMNDSMGFYPIVPIVFEVNDATQHYHVPLLLNPYGYSTYRGS